MYHHLVLSQGALLSLIGVYDPFQRKETRESIRSRLQDVRFDIPDDYNYCPHSWGIFNDSCEVDMQACVDMMVHNTFQKRYL